MTALSMLASSIRNRQSGQSDGERTCTAQMKALATGLPLNELSEEQLAAFAARSRVDRDENGLADVFRRNFEAMKRVLDRDEPDCSD